MIPKPRMFGEQYSSIFRDPSVARAYRFRPGYPDAAFPFVAGLIETPRPHRVLDAGCGTGFVARALLPHVDAVDAVDCSAAMIEAGRSLAGGDAAGLRWICAPVEEAPLDPPYALISVGDCLHWLDWPRALPRFRASLVPGGRLAVMEIRIRPRPWDTVARPVFARYSMNQDCSPYDMMTVVEALEERRLFRRQGVWETEPIPVRRPLEEWVEALHARNGFSRDRMSREAAVDCDRRLTAIVRDYCPDGVVEERVSSRVIWGEPLAG